MDTNSFKTKSANSETVTREWVVLDAQDQVLGRLASKAAILLRGKHKENFTPHVDCGDFVIVINADKVKLTGNKWSDREYVTHSGYPGGQRITTPAELMKKKPEAVVERAIRGMLPKNRLGREMFRNLHVYTGPEHPHSAQKPKSIDIKSMK